MRDVFVLDASALIAVLRDVIERKENIRFQWIR